MVSKTLNIGYSGTLASYDGVKRKKRKNLFLRLFWTFRNETVDSSTRSGYYLIQAVNILKETYNIQPEELKIYLWGSIDEANKRQVNELNLNGYFNFQGYLPKRESLKKLETLDILFLPTEVSTSTEFKSLFIPGKLFEYLQLRKPILSPSEDSDCQKILTESNLGIFTKPNDAKEIALILYEFIKNKDLLLLYIPNNEYIESFNFKNKTKELATIMNKLLNS